MIKKECERNTNKMREPILLHICCGPCSLDVIEQLEKSDFEVIGYFYNPNIHPYAEYKKRLEALEDVSHAMSFKLIVEQGYAVEEYFRAVHDNEQRPERCKRCYALRLTQAAKMAKEMGIKKFTSTLFYSIYQDHEVMKSFAQKAATHAGVEFLYVDFRTGWKHGVELSKKLNLYRQKYCGCIFSERERFIPEYRAKKQPIRNGQ